MTTGSNTRNQPTRYDEWLLRTMNDPRTKRFHATRASRRRFVAAHIVLTAAMTAGMELLLGTGEVAWSALLLVSLAAWVPVTGILNSCTDGLLELRPRVLDERQLAERSVVRTRAHGLTSTVLLTGLLAFFVAHMSGVTLSGLAAPLAGTAFALVPLHLLAPLWIAALRVPDAGAEPDGVAE